MAVTLPGNGLLMASLDLHSTAPTTIQLFELYSSFRLLLIHFFCVFSVFGCSQKIAIFRRTHTTFSIRLCVVVDSKQNGNF